MCFSNSSSSPRTDKHYKLSSYKISQTGRFNLQLVKLSVLQYVSDINVVLYPNAYLDRRNAQDHEVCLLSTMLVVETC